MLDNKNEIFYKQKANKTSYERDNLGQVLELALICPNISPNYSKFRLFPWKSIRTIFDTTVTVNISFTFS
jgi:hypothetical protein